MASIRPIVHYFYTEFLYFLKLVSPPVLGDGASDLRAAFERSADSPEHSVGVLHISAEWLHTEGSLNIFPAGPVNGTLQRL